jgi:heme A synthase
MKPLDCLRNEVGAGEVDPFGLVFVGAGVGYLTYGAGGSIWIATLTGIAAVSLALLILFLLSKRFPEQDSAGHAPGE